jgi:F420 biosynthesis protein FbiB-like protein
MSKEEQVAADTSGDCPADELAQTIQSRRTVRSYTQRPVSREHVLQLLEAARWAPSPHGRQPWRFAVISQMATRQRLADAMGEQWRQQLALDGQQAQTVSVRLEKSRQRMIQAPVIIIPCLYLAEMDCYADEERQQAEHTMAVQSLGCAVQNLLLLAHSLGLDCGWMCAPLFCPSVVCDTLNLDSALTPHALITVGYAAKDPLRRPRRPLDELIVLFEWHSPEVSPPEQG